MGELWASQNLASPLRTASRQGGRGAPPSRSCSGPPTGPGLFSGSSGKYVLSGAAWALGMLWPRNSRKDTNGNCLPGIGPGRGRRPVSIAASSQPHVRTTIVPDLVFGARNPGQAILSKHVARFFRVPSQGEIPTGKATGLRTGSALRARGRALLQNVGWTENSGDAAGLRR